MYWVGSKDAELNFRSTVGPASGVKSRIQGYIGAKSWKNLFLKIFIWLFQTDFKRSILKQNKIHNIFEKKTNFECVLMNVENDRYLWRQFYIQMDRYLNKLI